MCNKKSCKKFKTIKITLDTEVNNDPWIHYILIIKIKFDSYYPVLLKLLI